VTRSAVLKPGSKISRLSSCSLIRAASFAETVPRSTDLARMAAVSRPPPSSEISMTTWPPWWKARSRMVPWAGLPTATRCSGVSIPWSTQLRTRWVKGSRTASRMVLSSSVSRPSVDSATCLPQAWARSRTTRGSFCHRLSTGCMRVFMTRSCRSVAMASRRCEARTSGTSLRPSVKRTIWLRVSTSSPTSVISSSSRPTSTRRVPPGTGAAAGTAAAGGEATAGGTAAAGGMGASGTTGSGAPSGSGAGGRSGGSPCGSGTAGPGRSRPAGAAVVPVRWAGTGTSGAASRASSSLSSPLLSAPSRSTSDSRPRTRLTMSSSAPVISGSAVSVPSRRADSRFSATCVTDSMRAYPGSRWCP
jgi:hypothetical protein